MINPDCELVVSELAANVVQHAGTEITVRLVVDTPLRVEVHDGNSIIPAMAAAAEHAESGRGLFIVEALSTAWGISPHPPRKVRLGRDPARAALADSLGSPDTTSQGER